jgi:hypothetical protein
MNTINIKSPRFDLYEMVFLYWNGRQHQTKVVRRWLDFDDGCWWYKLSLDERQLYPEYAMEHVIYSSEAEYLTDESVFLFSQTLKLTHSLTCFR